jgi:hypothetical protein
VAFVLPRVFCPDKAPNFQASKSRTAMLEIPPNLLALADEVIE